MSYRITLVSRNFPPLTGGMERLVYRVYRGLSQDYTMTLIGPKGASKHVFTSQRVIETRIKPIFMFLLISLVKGFFSTLFQSRQDMFIGGSGVVAPVIYILSRMFRTKSVLLVHGLDLIVDSRIYQMLFLPFIRRCDLVIVNSKNTKRLALISGVSEGKVRVLNPGVDILCKDIEENRASMVSPPNGKKVLLSVGRLVERKGLTEFVQYSLPEIVKKYPNILLVIVGDEPLDALNKSNYSVKDEVLNVAREKNILNNIVILGRVSDKVLDYIYEHSDLFVFPLKEKKGDVEGFGMVAIEAAAHGIPTVAFNVGGVSDAISEGVSGYLVSTGDYGLFSKKIFQALESPFSRMKCREYAKKFSWSNYDKKLKRILIFHIRRNSG